MCSHNKTTAFWIRLFHPHSVPWLCVYIFWLNIVTTFHLQNSQVDQTTVKVDIFARLIFHAHPRKMNIANNKLAHTNTHFDIIFAQFYFHAWPFCREMRENFHPRENFHFYSNPSCTNYRATSFLQHIQLLADNERILTSILTSKLKAQLECQMYLNALISYENEVEVFTLHYQTNLFKYQDVN